MGDMDEEQFYREIFDYVTNSVVAVEDVTSQSFWVGCVLHKSATCVFILTQEENVSKSEKLNVHFFDSVQLEAKILTFCREFAVLYVDGIHESSTSVELRSQPFSFSEAVCVVPKTVRAFQKIRGQIPRPSCTSYNVDGSLAPTTNNYFLFICHHEGTQLMTPAPIFHEERTVNGFVIADCFVSRLRHGPSKKVDIHAKICVKASAVEIWLQEALGLDWRQGLETSRNEILKISETESSPGKNAESSSRKPAEFRRRKNPERKRKRKN